MRILFVLSLDFFSGILVLLGLVHVGSGIFTVVYSSTTAFCAIFSCCSGAPSGRLRRGQWLAVAGITLGLLLNAVAHAREDNAKSGNYRLVGFCMVLSGTCTYPRTWPTHPLTHILSPTHALTFARHSLVT